MVEELTKASFLSQGYEKGKSQKSSSGRFNSEPSWGHPQACNHLSSLWMLELRLFSFLIWGLEYAQSRSSELGHDRR